MSLNHNSRFVNTDTITLPNIRAYLQQLRYVDAVHKAPSKGAIRGEVSDALEIFTDSLALPIV